MYRRFGSPLDLALLRPLPLGYLTQIALTLCLLVLQLVRANSPVR